MSHEYTPVFHYNFTRPCDINNFEYKIACDGVLSRDVRGLSIHTNKYATHIDPGPNGLLDHIKLLTFIKKSYQTHEGEFIYEACMSAQQIITPEMVPSVYRSRIRNIYEDYRLCCSGLVVYDEDSMITAKILFTNDWIYGYYERRPGYKPNWTTISVPYNCLGDYAAFASIIPLCKRGNFNSSSRESRLDDYVRVGIGIDSDKGTIKFYVNRLEMYCISKLGYRLRDEYQVSDYGGVPYLTVPGCMRFGFGHFSYLDHNLPNNYSRIHLIESTDSSGYTVHRLASGLAQLLPTERYHEPYPDFSGNHAMIDPTVSFAYSGNDRRMFNFGQGMITRIKYIAGYIVNTRIKMHKMLSNNAFTCVNPTLNSTENSESYNDHSKRERLTSYDSDDDSTKIYNEDIYGPIPPVSRVNNFPKLKHEIVNRSSKFEECSDSIRGLLMGQKSKLPLYRDVAKSNTQIRSRDSDISSYSLGDLYKRSINNKFITKGGDHNELESNESENADESSESITFSSNNMTLNI